MDRWKMTTFGPAILNLHHPYLIRSLNKWACAGEQKEEWPCPTIKHCLVAAETTMEDLEP
jgi:hypothetical protein